MCVLSCVQLYETQCTITCQAPLSMEFSRQEYWSRLPFHSLGDPPDPGIKPCSPTLQADSVPAEPDYVNHSILWKIFKEMRIPDHLICLLRKLYVGQEATVRTLHRTTVVITGKGAHQSCILSPCLTYIQSTSWKISGWMSHKEWFL